MQRVGSKTTSMNDAHLHCFLVAVNEMVTEAGQRVARSRHGRRGIKADSM